VYDASNIIVASNTFTTILFAFLTFSSSPFDVMKVYAAIVRNIIAIGQAKNSARFVAVSKKFQPSSIFQLNTIYFHDSRNHTSNNQIIDQIILSLASVIFSSFHLEASIFIPEIIITIIAKNEIVISINQTISVFRVSHSLKVSISIFVSFQGVLNQEEYVVFQIDQPLESSALNKAPGILIKTKAITVYHNCLFPLVNFSSSVHILIIICTPA